MPRNVEIKARVDDPVRLRELALMLANGRSELIRQRDTFYRSARGRLKLREFGDGTGELIAYERPDRTGPKTSDYAISRTDDPAGLHAALDRALGVQGVVTKERTLVRCGRTRIHLDRVEGLGDFMELEVVLADEESDEAGQAVARDLMRQLGIDPAALVQGAYFDLLNTGYAAGSQGVG
jgi:adenylate cyclase class IV